MAFTLLLQGILLGIGLNMPTGPISVIGIKRTLQKGRLSGFLSDLGSITADMIYAIIAALSLSQFSVGLMHYRLQLRLLTGIFFIILGAKAVFAPHNLDIKVKKTYSLVGDYLSTFILTITNPVAIIFFPTLFASFKLIKTHNYFLIFSFIIGVLIGSVGWSLIFCNIIYYFKARIINFVPLIAKIFGIILISLGTLILITLLFKTRLR